MPERTGPPDGAADDGRAGSAELPDTSSGSFGGPPTDGASGAGPDFFERLLARHAPITGRLPGDLVRVRPRLAEPFERIEALGGGVDAGSDGADAPWSTARDVAPRPGPAGGTQREIHTERERTVLHTEHTPERDGDAVRGPDLLAPDPPTLRPVTTPPPLRPRATGTGPRGAARGDGTAMDEGAVVATPLLPQTGAAPEAGPGALRTPAAGAGSAARGAARAAAARRGTHGGERVVHVQIGRLEVSAAGPPQRTGPPERTPARRPPAVGLDEYLRRGRDGGGTG